MLKPLMALIVTSAFTIAPAFSCDSSVSSCGIDPQAFDEILYYTCKDGRYISTTGATQIARLVSAKEISLKEFKNIYRRTCDFSESVSVAVESKSNQLSYLAFDSVLYFSCAGDRYISPTGAKQVARLVSSDEINLNEFQDIYRRTCDFSVARDVAIGSKSKTLSYLAFDSVLYFRCTDGRYISTTGATQVAEKVASGEMNLNVFKSVYRRTCDFNASVEVSCQ